MQRIYLLLLNCFLLFISCSPKYTKFVSRYSPEIKQVQPDYSNLYYWAAHPYKHDPSDSVPQPLVAGMVKDSMVDVFFLHPTTMTSREDTGRNADVGNAAINAKTDYTSILYQASAFNAYRIFAPRYRQAHIRSYYTANKAAAAAAFDLAYQDVKASFLYYLEHFNLGRPIIIASHSQGSTHAQRLLKEFFEKGSLKKQLVAAYIPGMYIPEDYFEDLKLCTDSLQTGCIVAWRSFKKGFLPAFVRNEKKSAMVTNPLSWTTEDKYVPPAVNKGAVVMNFNHIRRGAADAQIHGNVLWVNRPRIPGSFLLRIKNYHVGDINLFYMNIRENLKQRVRAFKNYP